MYLLIQRINGVWQAKRNGELVASDYKLLSLLQYLAARNLIGRRYAH